MTKDDVIRLARETGFRVADQFAAAGSEQDMIAFAKLVAEHEREACAKVCYEMMLKENPYDQWNGMKLCMEAIRARGQA